MAFYKNSKKNETFLPFFKDLVWSERRFSILLVKVLKWQTGQSFLSTLIELLKMKFLKQRGKRGTEHLPWIIDLKLENWIFLYFLAQLKKLTIEVKTIRKKVFERNPFHWKLQKNPISWPIKSNDCVLFFQKKVFK